MPRRRGPKPTGLDTSAIPQFLAPSGYSPYRLRSRIGKSRYLSAKRTPKIKRALNEFIAPHVQKKLIWDEKPCSSKRFVDYVERAIALYESQRHAERHFDRGSARELLLRVASSIESTIEGLENIKSWPELNAYIIKLLMADRSVAEAPEVSDGPHEDIIINMPVERARRPEVLRTFTETIWAQLTVLAPVLNLAAERIKLAPGDKQLDWIAHEFAHAMVFAWCCATGRLPAIAKKSRTLVNKSPFIRLLEIVNGLIKPPHATAFREYATKAVAIERRRSKET